MSLNEATDTLETFTEKTGGGYSLGQSATDLVSLHGATPIAKAAGPAAIDLNSLTPDAQSDIETCSLTGTITGSVNGALVNVAATAGSCAGGSGPTAGQVDTAIATAVASIVTGTNEQLAEIQAKLAVATANSATLGQAINDLRTLLINKGICS